MRDLKLVLVACLIFSAGYAQGQSVSDNSRQQVWDAELAFFKDSSEKLFDYAYHITNLSKC